MILIPLFFVGGILSVNSAFHSPSHLSLTMEQISEIMGICDEKPSNCTCENGETLLSDKFFPGIFSCSPLDCVCSNGLTVNNLESIQVEEIHSSHTLGRMMAVGNFMDYWVRIEHQFQTLCDGKAPPESCNCANGDQITDFIKNTDGVIVCRAEECLCSNGLSVQVPDTLRYSFFSRMESVCDVKDCSCSSNSSSSSVIQPPFVSISDIKDCDPTHCTCSDESKEDLPNLPYMEDNLIESFNQNDKRRIQKLSSLCDGKEPQFCECYKREEKLFVYGNINEIRKCYPINCTCEDGSIRVAPKQRGAFVHILNYMDLTYGEEESKKMTSFYKYNCHAHSKSHP